MSKFKYNKTLKVTVVNEQKFVDFLLDTKELLVHFDISIKDARKMAEDILKLTSEKPKDMYFGK